MTRQLNILMPVLALGVSACGAAQVPAQEVSEADAAIRAAVEVGAEQYPEAALHLKMARDELANAKGLLEEDEEEAAVMALDRAEIEGELALARARAQDMQQQGRDALDQIEELKESVRAETGSVTTASPGGES